jgi:fatty acid desaturase
VEVSAIVDKQRDLAAARRAASKVLGPERVAALHRANPWLDGLTMVALPALTVGLVIVMARLRFFGPAWIAAFLFQGLVFTWYLEVAHDLFMHRRVGGRTFAPVLGFLYFLPLLFSNTWFVLFHGRHHKYVGDVLDAEYYKQDIDTPWKRLVFCTFIGVKLAVSRRFRPPGVPLDEKPLEFTAAQKRRFTIEKLLIRLFIAGQVAACILWRPFLWGYVLPFVIVSPVISAVRVMLEHGEANPDNLFHSGTYYRSGIISRLIFFWDLGDTHLVHHIFPAIPFYRLKTTANLLRPFLLAQGVRERTSMWQLVWGYFVSGQPHREMWSDGVREPATGDAKLVRP